MTLRPDCSLLLQSPLVSRGHIDQFLLSGGVVLRDLRVLLDGDKGTDVVNLQAATLANARLGRAEDDMCTFVAENTDEGREHVRGRFALATDDARGAVTYLMFQKGEQVLKLENLEIQELPQFRQSGCIEAAIVLEIRDSKELFPNDLKVGILRVQETFQRDRVREMVAQGATADEKILDSGLDTGAVTRWPEDDGSKVDLPSSNLCEVVLVGLPFLPVQVEPFRS